MRYWKRVKDGKTTTVESYSHDLDIKGAVEIEKTEFDSYIDSLPKPQQPQQPEWQIKIDALEDELFSLEQIIDDLKERIEKLEK